MIKLPFYCRFTVVNSAICVRLIDIKIKPNNSLWKNLIIKKLSRTSTFVLCEEGKAHFLTIPNAQVKRPLQRETEDLIVTYAGSVIC